MLLSGALKRMDGEDVFGCKIGTRLVRAVCPPTSLAYSSDEGYGTATAVVPPRSAAPLPLMTSSPPEPARSSPVNEWALALQQLPPTPRFCPPPQPSAQQQKPRKIRGTHGSTNLDQSCSSGNSCDDSRYLRDSSQSRAISPWNSSSFSEQSSEGEHSELTELTVTNLPPYEPQMLQCMVLQLFSQYVPVVRVSVWLASEGPIANVMFRSEGDARLAIARVHKRRLENQWTGRRLELSLGKPSPAPNLDVLRARLKAILLDQPNYSYPLLRLRDAYASRHCCALTAYDIAKVKDTVIIHEGFGRMVQLIDLTPVSNTEMEEAPWKCHIHGAMNTGHDDGSRILSPVFLEISVLAKHVKILLENHGGILPLLSFVECYEATFPPLIADPTRGVTLELLLRSVPGIVIKDTPSRHIMWRTERNETPSPFSVFSDSERSERVRERPRTAPSLEPMLTLFERELIDLLRTMSRCSVPFSKLIPAFHHHFGRQCRVADYGFTKLPDLLAALSNTIVVLGSGSSRVITISAAAQCRRWTTDLVKVLRAQAGRAIFLHDIPEQYQITFGKAFTPINYGVCTLRELMQKVTPQAVVFSPDGSISLPRRTPTPEEKVRTVQFAIEAIELLCYTPNLRMEFSKFVPAYHAHYGRQLRVAHYGCVKMVELFELIPDSVRVHPVSIGEREVRLGVRQSRAVVGQRLRAITPVPIANFANAYAAQFGVTPMPDMLDATSLEGLVIAAGGAIENGIVKAPGDAPRSISAALAAVAALSADRSVRGSSDEYFLSSFRDISGQEPNMNYLIAAGVLTRINRRVKLNAVWRTIWRVAQILTSQSLPFTAAEINIEYTKRYEPAFPTAEIGFESVVEFLCHYREVFAEDAAQRFAVRPGVVVPRGSQHPLHEDFSIHDTPPGQKGSRVFESPQLSSIWCSPPASALPSPSALLGYEAKRRTRLAAQFNAV